MLVVFLRFLVKILLLTVLVHRRIIIVVHVVLVAIVHHLTMVWVVNLVIKVLRSVVILHVVVHVKVLLHEVLGIWLALKVRGVLRFLGVFRSGESFIDSWFNFVFE
jgi:hypothetical protein